MVPASAIDIVETGDLFSGAATFGQWLLDTGYDAIKYLSRIFDKEVCPEREGTNTTHSFVVSKTMKDGVLADWYVCEYCGFNSGYKADSEGFSAAYDDYVETLQNPVVNSGASLHCYPTSSANVSIVSSLSDVASLQKNIEYSSGVGSLTFSDPYHFVWRRFNFTGKSGYGPLVVYFQVPISGYYYISWPEDVFSSSTFSFCEWGQTDYSHSRRFAYPSSTYNESVISSESCYFDASILYGFQIYLNASNLPNLWQTITVFVDLIPDESYFSGVVVSSGDITTRPTSISGGNYGIIGDNGQITKVEDNSTIINETNNTYYNPATGQTVPITGWTYDYSDRSYKVTLESGDTATITYGDENITIQEGDTIYNVYYLIDGSGSENPPCEHEWQAGETTPPTCTLPGKASYTCSKCQQTKTETLPALGHDWQVKQTVTTQYDDTGQLTQEGYTIFECSRCHEQYKSTDGTIPPGGGSGTDPGGDEGETVWDKLGNLIGAISSGAIELIDAALGKLLDALIALAGMLVEKLKIVVETVLSIFDELPALFGGFLDFLTAIFPFLPPELMTILTFGIIAVVFIGILKAVRR